MLTVLLPPRGSDEHGEGHYGASRGRRTHKGEDYLCPPGALVFAPVSGEVTKLGYCYEDEPEWRYVEITDPAGTQHRLFYVKPEVIEGEVLSVQDVIGTVQDLAQRYARIKTHIHYEIRRGKQYYPPHTLD